MLSLQTFNKMNKLTHLIEQAEIEKIFDKSTEDINEGFELAKVNEPGTSNYTFQLQPIYRPK